MGGRLHHIDLGNDFLNMTLKAQATKAKTDEQDDVKLKTSALQANNKQKKRQPTKWEAIFANHVSDKGLISKIWKDLHNSIAKKP